MFKRGLFVVIGILIVTIFVSADVWDDRPMVIWPDNLMMNDGRDGGINYQETVDAMHDMGANTLMFIMNADWKYPQLLALLENTKDTDIKVWVQMRFWINSYGAWGCNGPPVTDCTEWVKNMSRLSLQYPNLEAFFIDDFHPFKPARSSVLTPDFIREVIHDKDGINPDFRFIPVMYFDGSDHFQDFSQGDTYEETFLDGVQFWYWDSYRYYMNPNPVQLQGYINTASQKMGSRHFTSGLYAFRGSVYENTPVDGNPVLGQYFHDPANLREMLETARDNSDGVSLFSAPLMMSDLDYFYSASVFQETPSDDPAYDYRLENSDGTNSRGWFVFWYQGIDTSVPVSSGDTVRVQFGIRDNRPVNTEEKNYMYKQLLINDQILLELPLNDDGTSRMLVDKSFTVTGTNKANIVVRILAKRPGWSPIRTAYVETPTVLVNGVPVSANWQFKSGLSEEDKFKEAYNIIRDVFKGESIENCAALGGQCCGSREKCTGTTSFASDCTDCCVSGTCQIPTCSEKGGVDCCTASQTCPGANLGASSDCSGICCSESCITTTQELVGHWTLDTSDISGGMVNDISGNELGMTIQGSPQSVQGKVGQALSFDGSDDSLVHADDSLLDTNQMTFMVWIKPSVSMENTYKGVAAKAQEGKGWSWQLRYNSPGGYLGFQANDITEGSTWASLDQALTSNTWYFITCRFDGTHISIFLDGSEISSAPLSGITTTSADYFIGMEGWPTNRFQGEIDDARLYNYALTDSEIIDIYNSAASSCRSADVNADGAVDISELVAYISRWKSGTVTISELMVAIGEWKNGC